MRNNAKEAAFAAPFKTDFSAHINFNSRDKVSNNSLIDKAPCGTCARFQRCGFPLWCECGTFYNWKIDSCHE